MEKKLVMELLGVENEDLAAEMAAHATSRKIAKHEVILKEGEVQTAIPFLVSGIYRGYYTNNRFREVTDCFVTTPGIAVVAPCELGAPSPISIAAETKGELFFVPLPLILEMGMRYQEVGQMTVNIMMFCLKKHWEQKKAITDLRSEERYAWFAEKYPGLIDQVNHSHIAQFLNMTPETLSRVHRKRMEEEKA